MEATLKMKKRLITRLVIIAAVLLWALAATIAGIAHVASVTGLPMNATAWIYTGLAIAIAMLGWAFYRDLTERFGGAGFTTLEFVTPMAVASIWGGLWPAMQYWAFSGRAPLWLYQEMATGAQDIPVYWWGSVYTQYLGLLAILVVGYAIVIRRWMHN